MSTDNNKEKGMETVAEEVKKAPREVVNELDDQSYWGIVKRQFKKNKLAVWSMRFIFLIVFVGLMADFLANEKPLVCKYEGTTYFPVLREYMVDLGGKWPPELVSVTDWSTLDYEFVIWAPVPYSQGSMDKYNSQFVGPFDEQWADLKKEEPLPLRKHHFFGTDGIGRDVLAGMIHGTRVAMLVGVISMSIATFIGIIMGALAGYYGDDRLKMSRIRIFLNLLFLVIAYFYAFHARSTILAEAFEVSFLNSIPQFLLSVLIFIGIMVLPNLFSILLEKIPFLGKKVSIPIDILISRMIEVLLSIPRLLLLLAVVAAFDKSSIMLVMGVIGATSWTGIARFTRGELLRVRSLEYIEAAQSLGYNEFRTIFKHALPNSLTPVLIAVAFGVAGAILLESFLSFLGIGVPPEVVTWGKLLTLARQDFTAWWLAIIPGFAIFMTVTVYNLLGDGLTDALDPRLKQ